MKTCFNTYVIETKKPRLHLAYRTHGMLPDDTAMDAAFFVTGPGVPAGRSLGRIDMRDVAPTLAARLGLSLPAAEGRDLLN